MEIHTLSPEDIKETATSNARAIPIDEIDATFKSQYTGKPFSTIAQSIVVSS